MRMIDEPNSCLNLKQRFKAARTIRGLLAHMGRKYVIVVEHDLAALNHLSDYIRRLYGGPGVYGVATAPFSALDEHVANTLLAGHVPTENLRFRTEELAFEMTETAGNEEKITQDFLLKRSAIPTARHPIERGSLEGLFSCALAHCSLEC